MWITHKHTDLHDDSSQVDNAFWIWNFQGNLLVKQPLERFCQLMWRPRPPSMLSEKQIKVSAWCNTSREASLLLLFVVVPSTSCRPFIQKCASIHYNRPFALSHTLLCIIAALHSTSYLTTEAEQKLILDTS